MTAMTWKAGKWRRFFGSERRLKWEIFSSMGGILSWERI